MPNITSEPRVLLRLGERQYWSCARRQHKMTYGLTLPRLNPSSDGLNEKKVPDKPKQSVFEDFKHVLKKISNAYITFLTLRLTQLIWLDFWWNA